MRVATRGSALALAQVALVEAALGEPLERVIIQSHGDRSAERDLVPGAFTRAVDEAVLDGRADLAVHSLKDLPVDTPPGIVLGALLPRGPAGDVLVVANGAWLDGRWPLRPGARVGTSSARREALLRAADPTAEVVAIRGNVPTRLGLLGVHLEAVLLAEAGLSRLGWPLAAGVRIARLDLRDWPCAPGQGAIAVHVRADAMDVLSRVAGLDHLPTRHATRREREQMRAAGVGCHAAFAAFAADGMIVGHPTSGDFALTEFDRFGGARIRRTAAVPRWTEGVPRPHADPHLGLWTRACAVAPGGVHSPVRAFRGLPDAPRFIRSGRGGFLHGIDDERWLDLCNGWGSLVLGHDHPAVREAVARSLGDGLTFGATTPGEVEYAEEIADALGPETKLRFTCSGSEAVSTALRIARHATGRTHALTFSGGYHGHADAAIEGDRRFEVPFNDEERLVDLLAREGHRVAAVLVEAVPGNDGLLPQRVEWWRTLEAAARCAGALLIVDEVITGFRLRYGAHHPTLGIEADLITLGKIVGGGMPLAAVAGRASLLDRLAPIGPAFHAGTMTAHPLAIAAGRATLNVLRQPGAYETLDALAASFAAASRLPWQRVGSMLWPWLGDGPAPHQQPPSGGAIGARFARMHSHALRRGVYLPPAANEVSFVSLAHDVPTLAFAARALDAFEVHDG